MPLASARSFNVGFAADVPWGTLKRSAIDKRPVAGPVRIGRLGLEGDEQVDREHHGGEDQAVYAYAEEDLDAFSAELGRALAPGTFGENLTTHGLDVNAAMIGERWRLGTALLEVTSPRIPCSVFAGFVGEPAWVKRFTQAAKPGPYLRVVEEGVARAGDAIDVVERPAHGVTVRDVFLAKTGRRDLIPRLLEAPALAEKLKAWARERAT